MVIRTYQRLKFIQTMVGTSQHPVFIKGSYKKFSLWLPRINSWIGNLWFSFPVSLEYVGNKCFDFLGAGQMPKQYTNRHPQFTVTFRRFYVQYTALTSNTHNILCCSCNLISLFKWDQDFSVSLYEYMLSKNIYMKDRLLYIVTILI